jgi:hypothetical protein
MPQRFKGAGRVVINPAGGAREGSPWHRRLAGWLWANRIWFASGVAIFFAVSTAYVVWAVQDLPT